MSRLIPQIKDSFEGDMLPIFTEYHSQIGEIIREALK